MVENRLKIALDMDNTINKLSPYFINFLEYDLWGDENEPKNLLPEIDKESIIAEETESFEDESYKYYELDRYFPKIAPETFRRLYDYMFNNLMFWVTIPPKNNVYEAVRVLNDYFDLYIVTWPYNNFDNCRQGKLQWLKLNLPFIRRKQVIFDNKKGKLDKYDAIIDDNPTMLENAKKQGLFTIKFKHHYNEHIDTDLNINEWSRTNAMWLATEIIERLKERR